MREALGNSGDMETGRGVRAGLRRRLVARSYYDDTASFLWALYDRLLRRLQWWRMPFSRKVIAVRMMGLGSPLSLRPGTTDFLVAEEIFAFGEYVAVRKALQRAATVLDLGANCGLSVRYWQEVWPGARVVAVEPSGHNARLCGMNARTEPGDLAPVVVKGFAGGVSRKAYLSVSDRNEWGYQLEEIPGGVGRAAPSVTQPAFAEVGEIPVYTVPELLELGGISGELDLLKCDIEGSEVELFANCGAWVGRCRFLCIETHVPYKPADLYEALRSGGYRFDVVSEIDKGPFAVVLLRRK